MDFDLFPLEIKLRIFSFLTEDELRRKVAFVSSVWRDMSQSPYLRKELIVERHLSTVEILQSLTSYYRLVHVEFENIETWNWVQNMPYRFYVKRLEFRNCAFGSRDSFLHLIQKFPHVRSVKVTPCVFVRNECLLETTYCKHLENLHLDVRHNVTSHVCRCFGFVSKNCEKLLSLHFACNCEIDQTSFVTTSSIIGKKLKELTLNCELMSAVAYEALGNYNHLKHLAILNVTRMTDAGLRAIDGTKQFQALYVQIIKEIQRRDQQVQNQYSHCLCEDGYILIPESCHILAARNGFVNCWYKFKEADVSARVTSYSSLSRVQFVSLITFRMLPVFRRVRGTPNRTMLNLFFWNDSNNSLAKMEDIIIAAATSWSSNILTA